MSLLLALFGGIHVGKYGNAILCKTSKVCGAMSGWSDHVVKTKVFCVYIIAYPTQHALLARKLRQYFRLSPYPSFTSNTLIFRPRIRRIVRRRGNEGRGAGASFLAGGCKRAFIRWIRQKWVASVPPVGKHCH